MLYTGIYLVYLLNTAKAFILPKVKSTRNLSPRFVEEPSKIIQDIGFRTQMGDMWSYSELATNAKNHLINSASLITNHEQVVGVYSIDKNLVNNQVDSLNIHATRLIPSLVDSTITTLNNANVKYDILEISRFNPLDNIPFIFQLVGLYILSGLVFGGVIRFFTSGQPGENKNNFMNPLSMMMSNTQEVDILSLNVTFNDVAGCEEAKFELVEVVDFLKKPEKYTAAGAKIPKGVLLEGPPGTGKTLLARAVAGEAGVPFFEASGSQFIEMFVGVGASRVRDLFNKANENSPCVVFIDEIDAVGRQRGAGFAGGNDEREQTLNQILTNMDGFSQSKGVIVLAATNRADILDSALTRPGRFDRKIMVGLPDRDGRREIMDVHFKDKKISNPEYLDTLSSLTEGFSGADIANLANEAAILSVRYNETKITNDIIYRAYEKMTIGLPKNVETRPEEVIKMVAYHEVGHALVALLFKDMFNVQKITIQSNKNGAGGYTLFTPKEKFANFPTKKYMLANMIIALGGRAAEVAYYKNSLKLQDNYDENRLFHDIGDLEITTGASNDLKHANSIARKYVSLFGLGQQIGLYDSNDQSQPFLGKELASSGSKISDYTRQEIDKEIKDLVDFCYKTALNIIEKNKNIYHIITQELLNKKTLNADDIKKYSVSYY
jgi:cell division protease FtsH